MVCGLGRKLQIGHRISLTTLHLVYILFDNTKYGSFVLYLIYKGLLIRVWRRQEEYDCYSYSKLLGFLDSLIFDLTERFYAN